MAGVPEGGFKTLTTVDEKPGEGIAAQTGDIVFVLYHGKTTRGVVFDYTMEENLEPIAGKDAMMVHLGVSSVIKGWHEGLVGAKAGMVRTINIPYAKAYGDEGRAPSIPGKADLIFKIKVLKVVKKDTVPEIEANDKKVGTGPGATLKSTLTFSYKGVSLSGQEFDKQEKLTVPVEKLIPGFREAVLGMKAGGEREIIFPPNSPNPTGRIPYNQFVTFNVTVHSVK